MAQRPAPNRNRRSATATARTAGKPVSHAGKENRAGRGTLAKQRLPLFPEPDHDTPRVMLKRIIQTQPQVSPLAPQTPQHEETEESQSELPSKRISNTGEMQLPDLVPENTSVATFHMTKKRKKLSISEFERAAEKWLPQKQGCSTLDSTGLARSLHLSVGSLIPPDTVEKRGLARRPRNRKAIDVEAFEGRVEQNILKRKAQDCFGDSEAASGIQTALLTNDAEIVLSNTELFVEPQFDEPEQNKLPPPESHLWDSKTSAQRSESPAAAQEEAGLQSLGSSVSTNKKRTRSYSEDLILDLKHVGEMTPESPQPPAEQQDEKDHSQQDNPMEQLPGSEEVVDGTAEHRAKLGYSEHLEKKLSRNAESQIHEAQDARANTEMSPAEEERAAEGSVEHQSSPRAEPELDGVGAGRLDRHSHAFPSEKSGLKPLKEGDEEAAELLENQAVMIELDDLEDEATENEAEDPESEEVSMKTPAFVRAPAFKASLLTPPPVKPPAPKLSAPSPAKPRVPRSALQAKPERKTREPGVPSSLIKNIFRHYVKMPVAREAFRIVEKCSERYFKQLSSDLEAYTRHAGRRTVEVADLEVLMRRQGLVTDKMPLHVLIEHYLPLEYRKLLIPVAVSGNKVIPCK
ncbi:centromere protein T isoform X2 [Heliangelus exortis]|uniref:centromere protein T isoform X2 n=1 Tax=Heliangelus exortis TaxID=472823 RepID=UPI003A8F5303